MIFDNLPKSIIIDNENFPIKTDFRDWVKFEQAISKKDPDKTIKSIFSMFLEKLPLNIEGAISELFNFYSSAKNETQGSSNKTGKVFDYNIDSDYLYSAFMGQYNIDLQHIKYLHWFEFRSLLRGLSADCRLVEIIGYRSMKIDSKMTPSQKEFYNKMKRIYALPIDDDIIQIVKKQREEYRKENSQNEL